MPDDTIFALATGAGRSAVAVIRLSGPCARDALADFTGVSPEPRHAHFARFRDPQTNETLDEGLALWFPGPNSRRGKTAPNFSSTGAARSSMLFVAAPATDRVTRGRAGRIRPARLY